MSCQHVPGIPGTFRIGRKRGDIVPADLTFVRGGADVNGGPKKGNPAVVADIGEFVARCEGTHFLCCPVEHVVPDPAHIVFVRESFQEQIIAVFRGGEEKIQIIPGRVDFVPVIIQPDKIPGVFLCFSFRRGFRCCLPPVRHRRCGHSRTHPHPGCTRHC